MRGSVKRHRGDNGCGRDPVHGHSRPVQPHQDFDVEIHVRAGMGQYRDHMLQGINTQAAHGVGDVEGQGVYPHPYTGEPASVQSRARASSPNTGSPPIRWSGAAWDARSSRAASSRSCWPSASICRAWEWPARCGPQPVAYCRALAAIGSTVQHRDLRLGQRIERGGAVGVDPSFTRMQGRPSKRSRRTIGATVAPWLYTGITAQGLCWIAFMRMKNAAGCTGLTGDVEGESEAGARGVPAQGQRGRVSRTHQALEFQVLDGSGAQVGFDVLLAHAQCPIELGNAGHYGRDGEVSGEAGQVKGTSSVARQSLSDRASHGWKAGMCSRGLPAARSTAVATCLARSTEDAAEAAKSAALPRWVCDP